MYCRLLQQVPNCEEVGSLAVDDLVQMIKMIFAEYGLPKMTVSDAGTNFTSVMFHQFCRLMNIQQSIASSYHHESNSKVEACIKFANL